MGSGGQSEHYGFLIYYRFSRQTLMRESPSIRYVLEIVCSPLLEGQLGCLYRNLDFLFNNDVVSSENIREWRVTCLLGFRVACLLLSLLMLFSVLSVVVLGVFPRLFCWWLVGLVKFLLFLFSYVSFLIHPVPDSKLSEQDCYTRPFAVVGGDRFVFHTLVCVSE